MWFLQDCFLGVDLLDRRNCFTQYAPGDLLIALRQCLLYMETLKAKLQLSRRHSMNVCTYFVLYPIILLASFSTGARLALLSDISRSNQTSKGIQDPVLHVGARFTSRRLLADTCSNRDISITQGRDSSSSGIPQFVVQIVNTCRASSCAPSDIHVFCGWFASAPLVNPKAFKRLAYNDCLVNDGNPLRPDTCTYKDISISQSREGISGIPEYIVQIVNTCISDCAPADIHVYCGWFASAPLVNPNIFRRVGYNDCLVNGGKPLKHGDIIRFEYSNSFMYPIQFKSASFC